MARFATGWYLIYTRPNQEKKVAQSLADKKVNYFLPTIKVLNDWKDRKKLIEKPLFPSYIFIYLTDIQTYYTGLDADGALYYLKSGKEIAMVREDIVRSIQLTIEGNNDVEVSEHYFQKGKIITIVKGALSGLSGEIIEYNGEHKILVRIELLKRNLVVTVPSEALLANVF